MPVLVVGILALQHHFALKAPQCDHSTPEYYHADDGATWGHNWQDVSGIAATWATNDAELMGVRFRHVRHDG